MARRGDIATKARDGASFELRSGQFSLMVLAIRHLDLLQLQTELSDHVASAPALLRGAPVVLDLNPLSQLASRALCPGGKTRHALDRVWTARRRLSNARSLLGAPIFIIDGHVCNGHLTGSC